VIMNRIHWVISLAVFAAVGSTSADAKQSFGDDPDRVFRRSTQSSPFPAPEPGDNIFVVDKSEGLDTGCTFRSEGPLVFEFLVPLKRPNLEELVRRGLIPKVGTLRLPAYDVDFDIGTTEYPPERDRVYFNGHLVPTQYLRGENDVWQLNAFEIPVEWIKFANASSGEPGVNTIAIEIDVDSPPNEENWCTSIDWAAFTVTIPSPVVLVHGIFSGKETWVGPWTNELDKLAIPYARTDMGALDSIRSNAKKIGSATSMLLEDTGAKKVTVVAHSKGGLDSRDFAERDDRVARILQMGTPNAGSPLADFVQGALLKAPPLISVPAALLQLLAAPAGLQLTTAAMAIYNANHRRNAKTEYVALAGSYRFGGLGIVDSVVSAFYGGSSDLVVPVKSVHALSYTQDQTVCTSGSDVQSRHTRQTKSACVFNRLVGFATQGRAKANSCGACTSGLRSTDSGDAQFVSSIIGVSEQGTPEFHEFVLDSCDSAAFILQYGEGKLAFEIHSPSGRVVDAASAVTDPDVDFATFEDVDGLRFVYVAIDAPEPGTWTARVDMISPPPGMTQEAYVLSSIVSGSPVHLSVELDKESYSLGDTIIVEASLFDDGGTFEGLKHANLLYGLPGGQLADVQMKDDGVSPDDVAGDGVYAAAIVGVQQPGVYRLLVRLESGGSNAVVRERFLLAPVAAGKASLNPPFADEGEDLNENGLFDNLVVTVNVTLDTVGSYRVLGILTGSNGSAVATAATDIELSENSAAVALKFSGNEIFNSGIDGPYTLEVLRLAQEIDEVLVPVVEALDSHTTAAYSFRDFEHPPVVSLGVLGDEGVDLNGNSLYDELSVSLAFEFLEAGTYQFSARLLDRTGRQIDFQAVEAEVGAGADAVALAFDGHAVGANAVDGPWTVADLLVTGDGGSLVATNVGETSPRFFRDFEGAPSEYCGDGVLQSDQGEECDDGNSLDGDCCSANCELEPAGNECGDDGNLCTRDECDGAGICQHGDMTVELCDDGVACTDDICLPNGGCVNAPVDENCDDGTYCNGVEVCLAGVGCSSGSAIDIDDGVSCTSDSCVEETESVSHVPLATECDDSDVCTTDVCHVTKGCSSTYIPMCLPPGVGCADFNGDGKATATDALNVLRVAVGLETCPASVCDVNGDGKMSANDALSVLKLAVGIRVPLRCPGATTAT
jgi:cysteine-rich repeat protein